MISTAIEGSDRSRLARAASDAYRAWRMECAAASDAYRCWADAFEADSHVAWHSYEAALVREQRASSLYADLAQQVEDLASGDFEPGADLAA